MDSFEQAASAVPPEQKCIQGTAGRFTNYPVGDCFFGVPTDSLYGREPLTTLPDSTTRFHFYLGSDALDLIAAFTKSKYAATVKYLSIGDSSYADDAAERGRDYSAVVNVLSSGWFPSLRSLELGVWQLFANEHCLYGRLGNVTRLFDAMPSLEELGLYGCFELTTPVVLPALRRLQVELDDAVTSVNRGAISQDTFANLLCSQMPNLADAYIDLTVSGSEAAYGFPDGFLSGANVPSLTTIEFAGSFAPDTRERVDSSELARRPGLRIWFSSPVEWCLVNPATDPTMNGFETTSVIVAQQQRCQDRVKVLDFDDGVVIIVADGAGGTGGGEQAAEAVIREVSASARMEHDAAAWCNVLRQTDLRVAVGESTCVVVARSPKGIVGASVGDSKAWLLENDELNDLTKNQVRKPLLGAGNAQPVGFEHPPSPGLLLVSTDGFCNYVKRETLLREILWIDFPVLARKLVEMVRLPSGELWDDIGIVACRPRRPATTRKRYEIGG